MHKEEIDKLLAELLAKQGLEKHKIKLLKTKQQHTRAVVKMQEIDKKIKKFEERISKYSEDEDRFKVIIQKILPGYYSPPTVRPHRKGKIYAMLKIKNQLVDWKKQQIEISADDITS